MFAIAFGKLAMNVLAAVSVDPSSFGESEWDVIRGNRAKLGPLFIEDESSPVSVSVLCLLYEVAKYLHQYFMRRSSASRRYSRQAAGKPPAMCDLVSEERSVVTRCLQYLGFMATGEAPRTRSVWARYTSVEDSADSDPEGLARFRTGVGACSSWIEERHGAKMTGLGVW